MKHRRVVGERGCHFLQPFKHSGSEPREPVPFLCPPARCFGDASRGVERRATAPHSEASACRTSGPVPKTEGRIFSDMRSATRFSKLTPPECRESKADAWKALFEMTPGCVLNSAPVDVAVVTRSKLPRRERAGVGYRVDTTGGNHRSDAHVET